MARLAASGVWVKRRAGRAASFTQTITAMSLAKIHEEHDAARKAAKETFDEKAPPGFDFENVHTYTNADAEYFFEVTTCQDYVRLDAEDAIHLGMALQAANEAYNEART